jgi:hypothetical protein
MDCGVGPGVLEGRLDGAGWREHLEPVPHGPDAPLRTMLTRAVGEVPIGSITL